MDLAIDHSAVRIVLVAVVLLGGLGAGGPTATIAAFSDSGTVDGSVRIASVTADAGGPYSATPQGFFNFVSVDVNGSASTSTGGTIDSYAWAVNQSQSDAPATTSGSGASVTVNAIFATQGDVIVVDLTVTDSNGWTDTTNATITVT